MLILGPSAHFGLLSFWGLLSSILHHLPVYLRLRTRTKETFLTANL